MGKGALAAVLLAGAAAGGCGGSSHSSSSAPAASSAPAPSPYTSTNRLTSTASRRERRPIAQSFANARIPATFTIHSGGGLAPTTVSAPTSLPVALTMISGDGRPYQVRIDASSPVMLSVPAGGRASTLLRGLRAGRYRLEIDGIARGALVIGVQPGP